MNTFNIYVYENRSMSSDLSRPIMLENTGVDTARVHVPGEIDGTDMSTWAWWFVYVNAKKEKYSIPLTFAKVESEDGTKEYVADFELGYGLTGKSGNISYAIEAIQGDESGAIIGEWHTRTYGLSVTNTLQGNQVEYTETEQDIISALISRVNELITSGAEIAEIAETIESAAETAQKVIDSIPQDYSALSSDVDQLKADLEDLDERLDSLGDGVPTEVRQAILTLFQSAAYAETGLTDEIAVIASWAAVVTAIALNQTSISVSGASTNQLVATTTPAGGTVTWASSDTSVATVSSSGLVTGVGNGSCTITASNGGKTATCSVTVSGFATLTGISAVYSGGSVAEGTPLDSLKTDLVVTAIYSDSTTRTLTDYSLSGTLAKGTSTITVTYSDKTTTFNVTVTSDVDDPIVIPDRTYTPGYINDSGNIVSLANNYVSNMYIPFSGHIIIDFTKNRNDVTSCRIAEYDSNHTFIKRSYVTVRQTGGAESFDLDSNTAYVRVGFATTAPESVFANFEVLKNTGISNYLYYESGTIDDTGNEQTSNSRVRTGFIDLSNGTSAFKILYSALSNACAALKLYDSSKVYGEQIPNSFSASDVNTGTTYSFARLMLASTSTFNYAAVANSAIVIDGTLYRLKEGSE